MSIRTALLIALSLILFLTGATMAQSVPEPSIYGSLVSHVDKILGIDIAKARERFLKDNYIVFGIFTSFYFTFSIVWHKSTNILQKKYVGLIGLIALYVFIMSTTTGCFGLFISFIPERRFISQLTFSVSSLSLVLAFYRGLLLNEFRAATESYWGTFLVTLCTCLYLVYIWSMFTMNLSFDSLKYIAGYTVLGCVFTFAFCIYIEACWKKADDYQKTITKNFIASVNSNKEMIKDVARVAYDAFLNKAIDVDFSDIDKTKLDGFINDTINKMINNIVEVPGNFLNINRAEVEAKIGNVFTETYSDSIKNLVSSGTPRSIVNIGLKLAADAIISYIFGDYSVKHLQNQLYLVNRKLNNVRKSQLNIYPSKEEDVRYHKELEEDQTKLKEDQTKLKEDQTKLKEDQTKLEEDQNKLKEYKLELKKLFEKVYKDQEQVKKDQKKLETSRNNFEKNRSMFIKDQNIHKAPNDPNSKDNAAALKLKLKQFSDKRKKK